VANLTISCTRVGQQIASRLHLPQSRAPIAATAPCDGCWRGGPLLRPCFVFDSTLQHGRERCSSDNTPNSSLFFAYMYCLCSKTMHVMPQFLRVFSYCSATRVGSKPSNAPHFHFQRLKKRASREGFAASA
jgi:hypothetical protein